MSRYKLDDFTSAYVFCLLWVEHDGDGEPLDAKYSVEDFAPEAMEKIKEDCNDFQWANKNDLDEWGDMADAGHNFCLTRNGHGTGFWDRGRGELGDRLSQACKPYGEMNAYVGDDELLYVT